MLFKKREPSGLPDLPPNPAMMPTMRDYSRPPLPPIDPMQDATNTPVARLPTFPDSISKKGFSQAAIKDAVNQQDLPPLPPSNFPGTEPVSSFPSMPRVQKQHIPTQKYKVVEMEEWRPEKPTQQLSVLPRLPSGAPEPETFEEEPHTLPPPRTTPDDWSYRDRAPLPEFANDEGSKSMGIIQPPPLEPAPTPGIRSPPHPMGMIPQNKPIFVKIDKFKSARDSLDTVKDKLGDIEELLRMIREVKQKEDRELSSWEQEMENIKVRIAHVSTEIFSNAYSG